MPLFQKAKLDWRFFVLLPIPLLWALLAHYGVLQRMENQLLDLRFRARGEIEAPVKLMYVDVDSRTMQLLAERPWNRARFGQAADLLFKHGQAKTVGFDFVFSAFFNQPEMVDMNKVGAANRSFATVVRDQPDIILAAQYTQGEARTQEGLRQLPLIRKGMRDREKNDVPEMPEYPIVTPNWGRVGIIDFDPEYGGDAVPRWAPVFVHTSGPTLYHLSLQLVLRSQGLDEESVKIFQDRLEIAKPDGALRMTVPLHLEQLVEVNWFSKWSSPLNPRASMADVLLHGEALTAEDAKKRSAAEDFFKQFRDAIILIGPTDVLLQDLAPTPMDNFPVPKVGLHGNMIKTIMSGNYLRHTPDWVMWVAVLGLTLMVSMLAMVGGARGVVYKITAGVVLFGYAALCFELFRRGHIVLPMAAPLGSALTTSFVGVIWQLIVEEKAKGRIKGMFGTYLSPQLVSQMVESGKDPQLGGHDDEITAYFSDIQGFSGFSEKLKSGPLVELMNEYLTACTDIVVTAQGGTLDKFIGDAVVAMFGAPIPLPDHAFRACVATQLVHQKLGELRVKWKSEGDKWPQIVWEMQSRIGLNTGVCMIGNMGSRSRFNYTMMGDNVNLAARMESGAKFWGVYTMVAEATKVACEKHGDRVIFRPLGKIVVKGRQNAVPIHEIVGLKENVSAQTLECIEIFKRALEKYYARDWEGARGLFIQSEKLEPNQPGKTPGVKLNPSLLYPDLIDEAIAEPPPPDWDGRYVMKEK